MAADRPCFIGVAFLQGDPRVLWDQVVMRSTWGRFVHTEIFLQNEHGARFYTACSPWNKGFIPSARVEGLVPATQMDRLASRKEEIPGAQGRWELLTFPLSGQGGYEAAYTLILEILAMHLPYNSKDLWQCCLQVMLPFECDLDCENLETWRASGVFCSQVCLLILRRLSRKGVLKLGMGDNSDSRLEFFNSRGCSPNELYGLLTRVSSHKKKSI